MSYRFLDGTPVNGQVDRTQMVPVTILPQNTVVCDGCGMRMCAEPYVKGTDGTHFFCCTGRCEHYRKRIFIPYERVSIAIVPGNRES
jgi:hypothetical protein